MRIAIIGGSGFIGTRLVERLIKGKKDFKILDIAKSHFFPEYWMETNVQDKKSLIEGLRGCDVVINLAAQHRDNVMPRSLYDDVNVGGAANVCEAAAEVGIQRLIFTSSVAVYGFASPNTDEAGECAPFNDYGRTKVAAEAVYRAWLRDHPDRSLTIIRPTVVFGERNRGNVYNLLNLIASKSFIMVGTGKNVKSMAYVENVAAFIDHCLGFGPGEHLYNYVDKPDFDMNSLIRHVNALLKKKTRVGLRLPYGLGYSGGLFFDVLSRLTGKKYPISAIRVKKFCSNTQFAASKTSVSGFKAPVSLEEGISRTIDFEFSSNGANRDNFVFLSE
jgi:GlcNAc-P-P-Und epimerase